MNSMSSSEISAFARSLHSRDRFKELEDEYNENAGNKNVGNKDKNKDKNTESNPYKTHEKLNLIRMLSEVTDSNMYNIIFCIFNNNIRKL